MRRRVALKIHVGLGLHRQLSPARQDAGLASTLHVPRHTTAPEACASDNPRPIGRADALTTGGRLGIWGTGERAMHVFAELINPGDRIGGNEVLWVQHLWEQNAVLVAIDAGGPDDHRGAATSVDRFRADELVEIYTEPDNPSGGLSTG
jgi:hypothetical protein